MGNRDIHALPDLNVLLERRKIMQGSITQSKIVFLLLPPLRCSFSVPGSKTWDSLIPSFLCSADYSSASFPAFQKITLNPDVIFFS